MSSSSPPPDYAGDISATEAWDMLNSNPKAQLVDVRTIAEWNFVGLPDLSSLGRRVHCVEWQSFPSLARSTPILRQRSRQHICRRAARDGMRQCCFSAVRAGGRAPQPSRWPGRGIKRHSTWRVALRVISTPNAIAAAAMAGRRKAFPGNNPRRNYSCDENAIKAASRTKKGTRNKRATTGKNRAALTAILWEIRWDI